MRNVKTRVALLALGSLMLLNACNAQDDKKSTDPTLATVNGVAIHQSAMDLLIRQGATQGAPDTPEVRKALLEELVGRELARQDAVKQGLDKRPEVKLQMEMANQAILINAFMQDFVKSHTPTDDQLKAEYDRIKTQIGDKQYHARHILVKTEKEAKDIIAQLNKGAKFEKLAAKSLDQGSAAKGGDLGYNAPSAYVPPFAQALVSLKKGQTTKTPVQTQFGWHVIRVDDIKDAPPFDEVKKNLAPRVEQEQLRKYLDDLRGKAKIEYKTPVASAAPAPGGAPATPTAPAQKPADLK